MKYYKYIVCFLSVFVLLLGRYIIYMRSTTTLLDKENNIDNTNSNKELYYDCSFTKTYRVVNLLENYIAEVPEESYIVLDAYQDHNCFIHKIGPEIKKNLEVNKFYEFTYTLHGIGIVNDMEDVRDKISFLNSIKSDNSLKVLLEVKKTDKIGLEQVQEPICRAN